MLTLGFNKNSNAISELKDPFTKNGVETIVMRIGKSYDGNISYVAYIEFKNGQTSGEQKLTANDFNSLVAKVDSFINNLK